MTSSPTEEGWLQLSDGAKLYTKTWKTTEPLKARLIFVHGFSDHCNAYYNLFPTLASRGIETSAFDQRGWGRSAPEKANQGLTGPTKTVISDITAFAKSVLDRNAGEVPVFMMGHSMGGQQVLYYISQGEESVLRQIRGFLLESPFVALAPGAKPSIVTVVAGRMAAKVMPKMKKMQVIDAKLLSRDPVVQQSFIDDKLCHDTGTLEGLAGMLDRADALETGKAKVTEGRGEGGKTRIWFGHGTEDQVTDPKATQAFFERLNGVEDKELKLYEGWLHKLHAEPGEDAATFADDVATWILARSAPLPGEPAASPTASVRSKL